MSAGPSITTEADVSATPDAVPAAPPPAMAPARVTPVAAALPEPGKPWVDLYEIQKSVAETVVSRQWRGVRIGTGEPVHLRAVPIAADERRADAWRALETIDHPNVLRALSSHQVGGLRVEVQLAEVGQPLETWLEGQEVDLELVSRLVRALADGLGALHARGLAHFGVRTANIFVRGEAPNFDFVLGGLETAALIEQTNLLPISVDPMNAPPEAAGLFQHSPGPGLRAWDWWSLGRVVQEAILGVHVLGHMLQRDVASPSPELLARAEALLLERDSGATRAGAVETMPAMDKRLELLLRGLLTSARDARWDGDCVKRWLNGESVRELYRLPRHERMFRWRDQALTVAEAAAQMQLAEDWTDANAGVWSPEKPGTLAHFLSEVSVYQPQVARLDELRKLETATALKSLPKEAVREAITAVALLELAGNGTLCWRGQKFDEENLRRVFEQTGTGIDRLALLQSFAARPIILLIERCDIAAARVLSEFAHVLTGAESVVRQFRWLTDRDVAGRARLLRVALLSFNELRAAAKSMHDRFACSLDANAEKLFQLAQPSRPQLAALVWLEGDAVSRGFLTHVQWEERELARLRAEGGEEVRNLAWQELERALAFGPLVFSRWRSLVPAWIAWAPIALVVWPGLKWVWLAALPLVIAVALRIAMTYHVRRIAARIQPDLKPAWRFRDGPHRCREVMGAYRAGRPMASVQKALADINAQIGGLTALNPRPAPLPPPGRSTGVWAAAALSWIILAGALGTAGWWAKSHRPSEAAIMLAWNPPQTAAEKKAAEAKPLPDKISWPFKPGENAQVLVVDAMEEATKAQLAYIAQRGRQIADRYQVETIDMLVILQVPTKDKYGLVIYDAAHQQLVSPHVHLMQYAPLPRSWVELAEKKGIYLPD